MSEIIQTLKQDEGLLLKATQIQTQSKGREKNFTIGHGYNIDAAADPRKDLIEAGVDKGKVEDVLKGKAPIDEHIAGNLLSVSAQRAKEDAERVIPQFETLPDPVKKVMVELSYQLGGRGLQGFKEMRRAIARRDYKTAAKELMDSQLARKDSTSRTAAQARVLLEYMNSKEYQEEVNVKKQTKAERIELLKQRKRQLMMKRTAEQHSSTHQLENIADKFKQMMSMQTEEPTDAGT